MTGIGNCLTGHEVPRYEENLAFLCIDRHAYPDHLQEHIALFDSISNRIFTASKDGKDPLHCLIWLLEVLALKMRNDRKHKPSEFISPFHHDISKTRIIRKSLHC